MRPLIFSALLLLAGCSAGLVYKPAPAEKFDPAKTARLTGSVQPWGLYFTAVTQADGDSVRVIVLSEIGLKLLDFSTAPDGAEVYYKFDKLPDAAAGAFIRFARHELRTPCPAKTLSFTDPRTRAHFETAAQGGTHCR